MFYFDFWLRHFFIVFFIRHRHVFRRCDGLRLLVGRALRLRHFFFRGAKSLFFLLDRLLFRHAAREQEFGANFCDLGRVFFYVCLCDFVILFDFTHVLWHLDVVVVVFSDEIIDDILHRGRDGD